MIRGPSFGLQNAATGQSGHEIEHTVFMHVDIGGRDHDVCKAAQFIGEDVDDIAGFVKEAAAKSPSVARRDNAGAVEEHDSVRVIVDVEELPGKHVLRVAADFIHRVHALFMEAIGAVYMQIHADIPDGPERERCRRRDG